MGGAGVFCREVVATVGATPAPTTPPVLEPLPLLAAGSRTPAARVAYTTQTTTPTKTAMGTTMRINTPRMLKPTIRPTELAARRKVYMVQEIDHTGGLQGALIII